MASTHIYTPLADQNIRLLILLPGIIEAKLRTKLNTVHLDRLQPPNYQALSYTWGSPVLSHSVVVDLGDGDQILPVTENLHNALRHLLDPSSSRTLWVDAICIH